MAGLFFCLASAEGARLLFCPATMQPHKRLHCVLCRLCSYTTNAAKQCTGLCRGFSCDCTSSTAYDTRPAKADITPPAPRWSVSQRRSVSSAYQIPPPRRTLYRPAQPPYYNKVYKGADHASPAACDLAPGQQSGRTGWHFLPGGAVQQQGCGGRRGTIDGYRRISFRAFAR